VRIKVCGNTAVDAALAAVAAGADMLGFIMAPGTPRTVSVARAREIVSELPPSVDAVGVFVDRPMREVEAVAAEAGFTAVQLHGREGWQDARELAIPVIKAVRMESAASAAAVDWPPGMLLLADAHVPGQAGGTGMTFPWEWAMELALRYRLLLSGGLSGANVGDAIRSVRPWGVDASSRLESSPGIKDIEAVRRFVREARRAEEEVALVA
jgi:phosphoribosylanthranilate isomerase